MVTEQDLWRRASATDGSKGDDFWGDNFKILIHATRLSEFFPTPDQTVSERLNALSRLILYICIALSVYEDSGAPIQYAVVALGVLYAMWRVQTCVSREEPFRESLELLRLARSSDDEGKKFPAVGVDANKGCVLPTPENPFMNRLYGDPPNRPPACRGPGVQELAQNYLDQQLYSDVNDLYSRNGNQRLFTTTPSTDRVPDRENFANWLVKNERNCKEHAADCSPFEDLKRQRQPIPEDIEIEGYAM
jgi:hypothetical protein